MARRHFDFLSETIHELDMALRDLGAPLVIRVGDAVSVLEELRARHAVTEIHAHQETWNGWTYARDRRVKAWARSAGVRIVEHLQHGVHRRLKNPQWMGGRWDRMATGSVATTFLARATWHHQ